MGDNKFILDAGCGGKHFWLNKKHQNTIYIDIREEDKGYIKARKNWECKPDLIADFRDLPFEDKKFKLIVWDPPHLKGKKQTGYMTKKYGVLSPETWQDDLKRGFKELWRVLDDYGVLTLKFNNFDVNFKALLRLFPIQPLYGTTTVQRSRSETRWFVFIKIPKQLNSEAVGIPPMTKVKGILPTFL